MTPEAGRVVQSGPPLMRDAKLERLLADLPDAISAPDQLRLLYQPRIDLRSGRCIAVEALLRWEHPVLGRVPPTDFIPFIEMDLLMTQLTDWVLRTAIGTARRLRERGTIVRVGVNVPALSLHIGYFAGRLAELIESARIPAQALEVELTEGGAVSDFRRVSRQLAQIRRMGVSVAIDDFGTGFSNLSYLTQFPSDAIKIDRSFIAHLETEPDHETVVRFVIGLAHALRRTVIAEGIETRAAYAKLLDWGCDEGQGFLISRPLETPELETWLLGDSASRVQV